MTDGLCRYIGRREGKSIEKERAVSGNTYSSPGLGLWGTVPNVLALAHIEKENAALFTNALSIHTHRKPGRSKGQLLFALTLKRVYKQEKLGELLWACIN